ATDAATLPALSEPVTLRRSLGLGRMTLYGLGTILGAGIYVLTGAVAGRAGTAAPLSFLIAAAVAVLTGLSFAELCSRYPKSAGEALYVARGFGREQLGTVVGILVLLTGVVSAATIAVGFHGYLNVFVELPRWLAILGLMVVLTGVAAVGISESVTVAAAITVLEVGGLVAIVAVSGDALAELPARAGELFIPGGETAWLGVFAGGFLAFYAFIGFEDMVNVAEEVREPERVMPRAILVAVATSTVLYVLVAAVAVLSLNTETLSSSERPMADIFTAATGRSPTIISAISILAVVNGALIQLVMGARVLYGLGKLGWLPAGLARVNPHTRTPLVATALVAVAVTVLAALVPLTTLAETTSFVILVVFTMVNAALWQLKRKQPDSPYRAPGWVPPLATIACVAMLVGRGLMLVGLL
ncbi:MAG: APC family permease, partial [Deltaproteobacteria bacterium]|nr:APC family permease [Deltaproteobacteria bacterium]